jgi:hypothetical protein
MTSWSPRTGRTVRCRTCSNASPSRGERIGSSWDRCGVYYVEPIEARHASLLPDWQTVKTISGHWHARGPPRFRRIQVFPKDRLTFPPAGCTGGKPPAPSVPSW